MDNYNRMFPGAPPLGPGQGQGFPTGGQPPFQPGFPEGGSGRQSQPALGTPPSVIPPEGVSLYAVDPGSIRGCLFRYTYIRLKSGRSFWFYPVYAGRTSVAGYQYNPYQYRWFYSGYDVSQIRSFYCT
ncbi:transporter [Metabacillus sp. RGM 3146]|uniref:transporter n=1 Tax=Metabacillus sp. RGM 3146 TaxID=3401092 RepID=UPI003B9CB3D4